MARVSILSAVLLIAVSTTEAQSSHNLYKVLLTQKGYIQVGSAVQFIFYIYSLNLSTAVFLSLFVSISFY
jgi:hypothetical protein